MSSARKERLHGMAEHVQIQSLEEEGGGKSSFLPALQYLADGAGFLYTIHKRTHATEIQILHLQKHSTLQRGAISLQRLRSSWIVHVPACTTSQTCFVVFTVQRITKWVALSSGGGLRALCQQLVLGVTNNLTNVKIKTPRGKKAPILGGRKCSV